MRKMVGTLLGATTSLVLAMTLAQPAMAADDADPADSPALTAWRNTSVIESGTAPKSGDGSSTSAARVGTAAVRGKRVVDKRGSWALWTQNALEWYWTSRSITSSTAWQSHGYVFPNTASNGGITRTYKGGYTHNWRGTSIVGSGVVTPWGDVNVFSTSRTLYYALHRGGTYSITG